MIAPFIKRKTTQKQKTKNKNPKIKYKNTHTKWRWNQIWIILYIRLLLSYLYCSYSLSSTKLLDYNSSLHEQISSVRLIVSGPLGCSVLVCLLLTRITTKITNTRIKTTDVPLRPITADDTSETRKKNDKTLER